jgi:NTE family protein
VKLGLALGSGGARGLAHIAFLEVLDQLLIETSAIAGSSIGALVGALYAGGMRGSQLRELATGITLRDLPKFFDTPSFKDFQGLKGKKIEDWLREILPVKRFEDLPIPLRVIATDFWKGEEVVFSSGDIAQAVRASISIPGVFHPREIEGRLFVDGGVVNPVPFDLLEGLADFVVAVDVSGEPESGESESGEFKVPSMVETLLGAFSIMGRVIMRERAQDSRIALYHRPALRGFKTADFLKAQEILDSVREEAESFRRELIAAKADRKARRA